MLIFLFVLVVCAMNHHGWQSPVTDDLNDAGGSAVLAIKALASFHSTLKASSVCPRISAYQWRQRS